MTDPKLREARIAEAKRRVTAADPHDEHNRISRHIAEMRMLADLYESDWRPEPEVDAVTLAFREWLKAERPEFARGIGDGAWDHTPEIAAFRAGHAHALANCADVRRMDWLDSAKVVVDRGGVFFVHVSTDSDGLDTKIDRAMEGGE